MKLRLWPWHRQPEPAGEEPAADEAVEAEPTPSAPPSKPATTPEPEPERTAPTAVRPGQPASAFARPYAPDEEEAAPALPAEPPTAVSLTIDEAKTAIRAAGGDVIQIGFLANAYLRHRKDEPESRETAAARKRLCELVARRLKDRKLLTREGSFELLEDPRLG